MSTVTDPTIQSSVSPPAPPVSRVARFSIEQYDRMIAAGVFETGMKRQRLELIQGEIRPMSPIGPLHENVMDCLCDWCRIHCPHERIIVRNQQSVALPGDLHVPEPDIAWVSRKSYREARPNADDVFLIIEVAHSSIDYDTGEKADLYAAAGIRDYWVVDIQNECIEVRRDPANGRYRTLQTFDRGVTIRPLLFPDVQLAVETLFGGDRESDG